MWEKINSPIVVAVIVLVALFGFQKMEKPTFATELRGAYEELIAIAKDGKSDAEKTKAVQDFASEIFGQVREGISEGMGGDGDGKVDDRDQLFLDDRKLVVVEEFKFVPSKWDGRQSYIYRITNNSDKHLKQIRINHEFMKDGKMTDVENKWVSEIQVLPPGESIALKGEYSFPNGTTAEDYKKFEVDDVVFVVTGFQS